MFTIKDYVNYAVYTILGLIALVLLLGSWTVVGPGDRGVVVRMGNPQMTPLGEGFNFKLPMLDSVEHWDVKVQMLPVTSEASSSDLQAVHTELAINFRINPDKVALVRQQIGPAYAATIITPAVQESVKAVTARYKAEELLERRAEVRDSMETILHEKLENILEGAFIVSAFNIEDFSFDNAFNRAIEQKQVAEQEAQRARNEVQQAAAEADKKIEEARGRAQSLRLEAQARADQIRIEVEAEAEQIRQRAAARAEAIRVESEALRGQSDLIRLRQIEKWDGVMPRFMNGEAGNFLFQVNPQ